MHGGLVCDTNIWYGIAAGQIDPLALKSSGHALLACMVNFLELTSGMDVESFSRRRDAARAIQAWADDYLPDNERHIAALWSHPAGAMMVDVQRAINIVAEAPSIQKLWTGYKDKNGKMRSVGMHTLVDARRQRYRKFLIDIENVCEKVQPGYRAARTAGKVRLIKKDQRKALERFLFDPANLDRLATCTRDRLASAFRVSHPPTPVECTNARLALDTYVRGYCGYLVYSASEAPPDHNDLGDVEFLLYVQDGRRFFTKEKRWLRVAEIAGLTSVITNAP